MKCDICNRINSLKNISESIKALCLSLRICPICINKHIPPDYCTGCRILTKWIERINNRFECKKCRLSINLVELTYCPTCDTLIGYDISNQKGKKVYKIVYGDKICKYTNMEHTF
jgi:hypothetical protein